MLQRVQDKLPIDLQGRPYAQTCHGPIPRDRCAYAGNWAQVRWTSRWSPSSK